MRTLWVESYRPDKVSDYVFKDDAQKEQVLSWIKTGALPQLLFSGSAGTGKCLAGTELVDVMVDTSTLSEDQQLKLEQYRNFLNARTSLMNTYRIPIKELFSVFGIDQIDYEKPHIVPHSVMIDTPNGFQPINAFVKKKHQIAEFVFDDTSIKCSVDHLVFSGGVTKKIKECSEVDFLNGSREVKSVNLLDVDDVYDVSLDHPHQYVTPNGMIHHNTTLAKLLLKELNVDWGDVLVINASMNNGVDYIRETINGFVSTMPFGEFKYVLLDEADFISPAGQASLRNLMEAYSNTARFILTANYPQKIIPAIHSRCQGFHIETLDRTEFTARVATILITEQVEFDIDTLDLYVAATYPDMRKCINLCQQNSQTGKLTPPESGSGKTSDYQLEAIALFRNKQYKDARTLIASQIQTEEYEDFYRFMYRNLDLWCDTEMKEMSAILAIRNGLVKHVSCADSELNLSATLVELEIIARS